MNVRSPSRQIVVAEDDVRCNFIIAHYGRCYRERVYGADMCEDHMKKRCGYCDKPAVRECSFAGSSLVCGFPLCEDHDHRH